jgi:hypothetical protein
VSKKPLQNVELTFLAAELPRRAEASTWNQTRFLIYYIPFRCLPPRVHGHSAPAEEALNPALSKLIIGHLGALVPHCIW